MEFFNKFGLYWELLQSRLKIFIWDFTISMKFSNSYFCWNFKNVLFQDFKSMRLPDQSKESDLNEFHILLNENLYLKFGKISMPLHDSSEF